MMTSAGKKTDMVTVEEGSNNRYVQEIKREASNNETQQEIKREASNNEIQQQKKTDVAHHGGHVVDIDKWANSMARMLEDVPQYMCRTGHPGRICRIPESLREVDAKAYEPYFIAFGPYHRDSPSVQRFEKRKLLVLKFVLEQKQDLTLLDFLQKIKNIEPEARSFYSDIDMESEKFVRMLLLDGLYIVTVFCGMEDSQDGSEVDNKDRENHDDECMNIANADTQMKVRDDESDEPKIGERWFRSMFPRDLFLLENQLPFFVLQKIYALAYYGSETHLLDIMKQKVGVILSDYMKLDPVISPNAEVHHILHLCHIFFRPILQQQSPDCQFTEANQMFRLGSAVQLYKAGVSFEARSYSSQHSLLDITFSSSGKMVIPGLYVDDKIASLLRNLAALEQMKYPSMGLHVSSYIVLLLHLITTPKDVKLLRQKGIIQHHLASDKEMMYLVNKLGVGLSFDYTEDTYSLKPIFQELKRYTDRRVPRWRRWLRHRYFDNPWTTISLLAASLLLILSVVQTFYVVYSYYKPCCDNLL